MQKPNERALAIETLTEITSSAYNNISLQRALRGGGLSPVQRAFVTEAVNGTLRNLIYIDYIISHTSSTAPEKMRPFILNTLRVSVYQILFMDRVPSSAACDEAVKIVKARGFGRLSGFVNGVLRSIARGIVLQNVEPAIRYSYPEWLAGHFISELGEAAAERMFRTNALAPDINVAANRLKTDAASLKQALEAEGMLVRPSEIFDDVLHVSRTADISASVAFGKGLFHVIDESSVLAARMLDPAPGSAVLDVCAAPGGKALYAAGMMKNRGIIRACDIHEHKLELIRRSAHRLGADIITTECRDARCYAPELNQYADFLLIDAPCSGLGLIRKKPDIKYKKTAADITALAALQREILQNCSRYVKPGGILVYSTCTISTPENQDNIRWFTENFPFELQDINGFLPKNLSSKDKFIQIIPGDMPMDGFFIARLKRKDRPCTI